MGGTLGEGGNGVEVAGRATLANARDADAPMGKYERCLLRRTCRATLTCYTVHIDSIRQPYYYIDLLHIILLLHTTILLLLERSLRGHSLAYPLPCVGLWV